MSEPITIIGAPVSPYVRKVMAVCDLKGVPYRTEFGIPLTETSLAGKEFRKGPLSV